MIMKVSIVTPSFNQAPFLPTNLASVRSQKGVEIEHIVVDPGSSDGSTEIAREAPGVRLIAEPDRGQSHGICKGFAASTGDVVAWLNSDDFYPDDTVPASVARCFADHPEVDIVYGDVNFVDAQGAFLRKGFVNPDPGTLLESFQYQVGIVQPGVFWRRRVFLEIGGPSEEFEYCMDYELWVRMASGGYRWKYLPKVLAHHRWWDGMKTSSRRDLSLREHFKVCDRYFRYVHWKWLDRYADYLCTQKDGVVHVAPSVDADAKSRILPGVIDEVVTREMLKRLEHADDPRQVETLSYIRRHHPQKSSVYFHKSELDILSEESSSPDARERPAWNVFTVTRTDGSRAVSYHVPDNFSRYFDFDWHAAQLEKSREALRRLSLERRGDTCVIVGNGPSLLKSDLSLLKDVDTIISNFALSHEELRKHARFLTVVNDLVARQGAIDFNASNFIKFVPFWLANHFNENDRTFFVNATVRPEFGFDFVTSSSWRSTVSFFNMQLAYALGYRKAVLIGFDHSYVQPRGVVEGDVIRQREDDGNHFDPRYFKGKDWQAADTDNMEAMYRIAGAAYEGDGREIVNCTVGGRLEVFRRGDFAFELGKTAGRRRLSSNRTAFFPKLLMIDSTPVGHLSATGQLKETFLSGWPGSRFLQIWEMGGAKPTLHALELGESVGGSAATALSPDAVVERCLEFQPDVVYFRPVDSELLFEAAGRVVAETNRPLVVHMMDDWPERLRHKDNARFLKLDAALRDLLARAHRRLSICRAMSEAYRDRYGGWWLPLANGVNLSDFPAGDSSPRPPVSHDDPFVIRYMGGLAEDMTLQSVLDIARAVATLREKYPVRFEIFTMDWWRDKGEKVLGGLPGVSIGPLLDVNGYRRALCDADLLVIAYNFDPESIRYIGLSLANKMPECLASGTPLLAYGPPRAATIDYLKRAGCALVVDRRDETALLEAVGSLVAHPQTCRRLGTKGRSFAAVHLSKEMVRETFREYLTVDPPPESRAAGDPPSWIFSTPAFPFDALHPGRHFRAVSSNVWRCRFSNTGEQKQWYAVFNVVEPTAPFTCVAGISLAADREVSVRVTLGRQGDTPWECASQVLRLSPGVPRSVHLRKEFTKRHTALKVQVELPETETGSETGAETKAGAEAEVFELSVRSLFLSEPLAAMRQLPAGTDVSFAAANRLLREKNHHGAMVLYLLLRHHNPAILAMYRENALYAARKLGMCSIGTVESLVQWIQ